MKHTVLRSLLAAASLALVTATLAAETKAPKAPKPIQVEDKVTVKVKVEAIDHTGRTLTVKGPKGELSTYSVDEAVSRFDQMKVGDVITATYYESVLVEVQEPGAAPVPESAAAALVPTEGAKPSGVGASEPCRRRSRWRSWTSTGRSRP
jgi:hypothetical protein